MCTSSTAALMTATVIGAPRFMLIAVTASRSRVAAPLARGGVALGRTNLLVVLAICPPQGGGGDSPARSVTLQNEKAVTTNHLSPTMPALADHNAKEPTIQPFKARPVNRAVLDSVGDLGVPRVAKRDLTKVKEFSLSSSARSKAPPAPSHEIERPLYSSFGQPKQSSRPNSARGTTARVVSRPAPERQPAKVTAQEKPNVEAASTSEARQPSQVADETAAAAVSAVATVALEAAASGSDVAVTAPSLSKQRILELQSELSPNEQLPVDFVVMSSWTEAQLRKYFESGGQVMAEPPQAPLAGPTPETAEPAQPPATPDMIRVADVMTPPTVEFH